MGGKELRCDQVAIHNVELHVVLVCNDGCCRGAACEEHDLAEDLSLSQSGEDQRGRLAWTRVRHRLLDSALSTADLEEVGLVLVALAEDDVSLGVREHALAVVRARHQHVPLLDVQLDPRRVILRRRLELHLGSRLGRLLLVTESSDEGIQEVNGLVAHFHLLEAERMPLGCLDDKDGARAVHAADLCHVDRLARLLAEHGRVQEQGI
mmetsp:Transcript_12381/g.49627  ORF Transcript_12381/g.49627 Transcript_12381/m.49627 type:complete len:208 (-) Transcript_12381:1379-2002(-)